MRFTHIYTYAHTHTHATSSHTHTYTHTHTCRLIQRSRERDREREKERESQSNTLSALTSMTYAIYYFGLASQLLLKYINEPFLFKNAWLLSLIGILGSHNGQTFNNKIDITYDIKLSVKSCIRCSNTTRCDHVRLIRWYWY